MILALLSACVPPDSESGSNPTEVLSETGSMPLTPTTTAHTGTTGDTGTVAPPVDCSLLVAAADVTFTSTSAIRTEEDFDFDGQGYLLSQRDNDLQGIDRDGDSHFVAANIGRDATGIRSTAHGDVLVAQPSDGTVRVVDPITGASQALLTSVNNPNGIEAGEDGMMYVSENMPNGSLLMVDPTTGVVEILLRAPYMNGIVLSPDEQTLYFTLMTGAGGFDNQTDIGSIGRDSDGNWDDSTTEVVYTHPAFVGSITIDACGNLYGLEYSSGRIFRLDTATLTVEPFGQVSGSWEASYPALHFAPGFGGWDSRSLFVTTRSDLFEFPTGVPGSHVLTP